MGPVHTGGGKMWLRLFVIESNDKTGIRMVDKVPHVLNLVKLITVLLLCKRIPLFMGIDLL